MKAIAPSLLLAALLLGSLFAVSLPAQSPGLTPEQVMRLRTVTGVFDCGDAGVAFTRIEPRLAGEASGRARQHLYLCKQQGQAWQEQVLVGSKHSIHGVATHAGGLSFIQKGAEDKTPQVYAMDLQGGEVQRITQVAAGVRSYKWSPDHSKLAYTSSDPLPADIAKAKKAGFRQRVVDEDFQHISLWLLDLESGESQLLTKDRSVFGFEWSPDGKQLALALAPRNLTDDSYMFKRLYLTDLSGEVKKLVDNPGKLGSFCFSPDGSKLAYISGFDKRDPHDGSLFMVDIQDPNPLCLSHGFKGMVQDIAWQDEQQIHALVSEGVRTYISTVQATANTSTPRIQKIMGGEGVDFHHLNLQGDKAYVTGSNAKHPAEAFALDLKDKSMQRLTDSNPWLAKVPMGSQEIIRYRARDGLQIEGLLMYPVDHKKGQRYPMVIVAHGGPESHFTEGWNTGYSTWGQILTGRGYFVWYPNYRASTGYGVDFAKADHGDPMGKEFTDHLDAIDLFVEQGLIDRQRVGIGGGSYGGYTAAWAATRHSKHFAAAVSFVPFVDIRSKWLTSDIPWEFYYVHYEETLPHMQLGLLSDRSPLSYAHLCETPLLLLGGTADPRVHPSQPHMLYRAVKMSTKTPVRYVQYPGEGHGNRINTNRYDYCLRTLRWFDHYLKGESASRQRTPPDLNLDYSDWYANH